MRKNQYLRERIIRVCSLDGAACRKPQGCDRKIMEKSDPRTTKELLDMEKKILKRLEEEWRRKHYPMRPEPKKCLACERPLEE